MDRLISENKVLKAIDNLKANFTCYDFLTLDEVASHVKAIPSAEPKAVLYSGDGYADGYMVYDMAECPNCGYEYENGDKDWGLSYCPNCGQKLNWERSRILSEWQKRSEDDYS